MCSNFYFPYYCDCNDFCLEFICLYFIPLCYTLYHYFSSQMLHTRMHIYSTSLQRCSIYFFMLLILFTLQEIEMFLLLVVSIKTARIIYLIRHEMISVYNTSSSFFMMAILKGY